MSVRVGADTAPDLFQPRILEGAPHVSLRACLACDMLNVNSLRNSVLFLGCCVQSAVVAMLLSEYHHCRREIPRRAREICLDGLVGFAIATTFEVLLTF